MLNIEKYFFVDKILERKLILSADIPFSQTVVDACKANLCGRYGKYWTCPPGVGDISTLEEKIKSYKYGMVFTTKFDLEDWFDVEGMNDGINQTKKILYEITEQMKSDGISILALGCEGCNLCEKCTYPDSPCRYPERAIVSVEAAGINVVELALNAGLKYNNGKNTVTYFCIVLFGE